MQALLSLESALQLLEQGQISSVELLEKAITRIDRRDHDLHAFVTTHQEQALQHAKRIDQLRRDKKHLGPLAGIVIAHKDVFHTKGIRTTAGSKALNDFIPTNNAAIVQILEDAGAISIGKTHCHEFAFGSPDPSDYFPASRNPINTEHMPGSSSSGSATAVGAGFCFAATGSDTGGSVRHPAAACGLIGMKPTRGQLPTHGLIPLAPSLDTVGVLTRHVGDNLIMWSVMTHQASYQALLDGFRHDLQGLRMGVDFHHLQDVSVQDEVRTAFLSALEVLKTLGAQIVPVELPELSQISQAASAVINFEATQSLSSFYAQQKSDLGVGLLQKLALAKNTTQDHYQRALEKAQQWTSQLHHYLDAQQSAVVDVMVSIGREAPAETMQFLYQQPLGARSTCNRLYSLTGHPAITVPMGNSVNGLPLAIQFAAMYDQEYLLYQVADAFVKKAQKK
jgi:aspartyl-tRNA(Asn)/glutamyl-tRNA(Gln) amidotransferase subunit A